MNFEENARIIEELVMNDSDFGLKEVSKIIEHDPEIKIDELRNELKKRGVFIGDRITLHTQKTEHESIEGTQDFYAVIPYSGPLHEVLQAIQYPMTDKHGNQLEYFMREGVGNGKQAVVRVKLSPVSNDPDYEEMDRSRNQERKEFLDENIKSYNLNAINAAQRLNEAISSHFEAKEIKPISQEEMREASPFN